MPTELVLHYYQNTSQEAFIDVARLAFRKTLAKSPTYRWYSCNARRNACFMLLWLSLFV